MPMLAALAGIAALTGMDTLVKGLSADFGTFQIAFLRSVFVGIWIGLWIAYQRPGWPRRDRLPIHALRAVLSVITACSFFYALAHIPIVEVFALSFTAPLFITLFGALFLREPVRWPIFAAIAIGFAGMLIIVFDAKGTLTLSTGFPRLALAAAILSPVSYALSIVVLRAQAAYEPGSIIVLVQTVMAVVLLAPLAALEYRFPDPNQWLLFALTGLFATVGFLAITHALAHITAARFSAVEYSGLLWAALFGYVFFAEITVLATWAGAALIIAACLIVLRAKQPAPA